MYTGERDEYIHSYRSTSGCVFWLFWVVWAVVTYFAFTFGESLGKSVEVMLAPETAGMPRSLSIGQAVDAGPSLNLPAAVSGGLVAGVVLAIGQGLVLLPFMKLAGALQWALVTLLGRAVGWVAIYLISKQMVGLVVEKDIVGLALLLVFLVGTGIIVGLALGYPQSILLRRRVQHPTWWVFASLSGPAAAGLLISIILFIEGENVLRGFNTGVTAAITAVSTAIALTDMFSLSISRAEWMQNIRWRKERSTVPHEDTVLGSSLYGPPKPPQS